MTGITMGTRHRRQKIHTPHIDVAPDPVVCGRPVLASLDHQQCLGAPGPSVTSDMWRESCAQAHGRLLRLYFATVVEARQSHPGGHEEWGKRNLVDQWVSSELAVHQGTGCALAWPSLPQ